MVSAANTLFLRQPLERCEHIWKIRCHHWAQFIRVWPGNLSAIDDFCATGWQGDQLVFDKHSRVIDDRLVCKAFIDLTSTSVLVRASCPGDCIMKVVPVEKGPCISMDSIPAFQSFHRATSAKSCHTRVGFAVVSMLSS